jgi:hypothetical protein
MTLQTESEQICCPRFDPDQWNDKIFDWSDKFFIKDKVTSFFFMPLNFGSVMKRLNKLVADSESSSPDWLCLSEHVSKWKMNIYLNVDKQIPDTENTRLMGSYYCKVYEGPYSQTNNWINDFQKSAESLGYKTKKPLLWYTTCPKCAKKYGKNYVAIFSNAD